MARGERKFDEALILEYKETNNEELFNQIVNNTDIKKYVYYVCNQKIKNSPTTLFSLDDLINLAYLVLWQSIHKYRYICPTCRIQAKTFSSYKLHMLAKHDEYSDPMVSISRYLKFNLGAYLQNEIRREYSLERQANILTVNLFTPEDEDETKTKSHIEYGAAQYNLVSHNSVEDEVIFKSIIPLILKKFDKQTVEIFRYLFEYCLKQRDIAILLCQQGRYSSEQSAAVVVSRIIKTKIKPAVASVYAEFIN